MESNERDALRREVRVLREELAQVERSAEQDVTERTVAEEALRRSGVLFRAVIEKSQRRSRSSAARRGT